MKRILAALLALVVLPLTGSAQGVSQVLRLPLVEARAYATNTYSACVTLGEAGSPIGRWQSNDRRVQTSGANTTVTSMSSNAALSDLAVGDVVKFIGEKPNSETKPHRVVATWTNANSMTVNTAIDLDPTAVNAAGIAFDPLGYNFVYRELQCSTAATFGTAASYVPLKEFTSGAFTLIAESESGGTGGLDYQLECYVESATDAAVVVTSGNITQASIPTAVILGNFDFGTYGWTHCRVKVKVSAGTVTYSAYATLKEGVR